MTQRPETPVQDFYCEYVLNNKVSVQIVQETPTILAFHHTKPSWDLHIVIIPKQHIRRLVELEDLHLIQEIFEVAQTIIKAQSLHESNYRIITNGGSFQDSQHLHFHLVSGKQQDRSS